MKINFVGQKIDKKLKQDISKMAELCFKQLNQNSKRIEFSINFISESQIQELNSRLRKINSVTDVLSFPYFSLKPFEIIDIKNKENYTGSNIYLGDMAICLNRAREQAIEFGHSLDNEILKLVLHSILHLMGFDHIEDKDYKLMNEQEEKIATIFYTNNKI